MIDDMICIAKYANCAHKFQLTSAHFSGVSLVLYLKLMQVYSDFASTRDTSLFFIFVFRAKIVIEKLIMQVSFLFKAPHEGEIFNWRLVSFSLSDQAFFLCLRGTAHSFFLLFFREEEQLMLQVASLQKILYFRVHARWGAIARSMKHCLREEGLNLSAHARMPDAGS